STFFAILLGTICGMGAVSFAKYGLLFISLTMVLSSIGAWIATWYLPKAPAVDKNNKIDWNLYRESLGIIRDTARNRTLFLSIIGISWFWVVGAIFLTQIGNYSKVVLGVNQSVATLFMVIFTIGIGAGSYFVPT